MSSTRGATHAAKLLLRGGGLGDWFRERPIRYLLISRRGIDQLLALLDGLAKVRIADGARLDQIHRASEEPLQIFLQAEITIRVLGGAQGWELHKKVKIARGRVEGAAGGRTEQ